MIILVTGGAGFIGSHLCEKLIKMKKQVIAFEAIRSSKLLQDSNWYLFKSKLKQVAGGNLKVFW